jgi:hypothetical protein
MALSYTASPTDNTPQNGPRLQAAESDPRLAPGCPNEVIVISTAFRVSALAWAADLFKIPAGDIWKINVKQTWVGGTKVFGAT